jgi:hypothetical protein
MAKKNNSKLCEACQVDKKEKKHTCPKREELDGDFKTKCNCCESCENECAQDV